MKLAKYTLNKWFFIRFVLNIVSSLGLLSALLLSHRLPQAMSDIRS
jgi:hypothetical protein